ncbi:uncharacterized protein LOC127845355 isoform X2 [Dreissena polymorpha]|uniref:uncharacterized protein LOC127845355 isoform X2 n=1 Tax=Dreissena polymorpha TaxID=45954 RepID=UPI0022646C29|nr:uncharacterized protein LOC127845355 isoform X2 [Dreissena polymorpha]
MANKVIDASVQQKVYTNFVNKKPWVHPDVWQPPRPGPSLPGQNASALFGYEIKRRSLSDVPPVQKPVADNNSNGVNSNSSGKPIGVSERSGVNKDELITDAIKQSENKSTRIESGACTALERGLHTVQDKVNAVNKKADNLDDQWKFAPGKVAEVEADMTLKNNQAEELEWRNKLHSAKIHELERELRSMKVENDVIKGRLGAPIPEIDEDGARNGYSESPRRGYDADQYNTPRGAPVDTDRTLPPPEPQGRGKPQYKNDQYGHAHHAGGDGEEPYWGFNRYYNPDYVTAYRREHVPYYAKQEEKTKMEPSPGGLYIVRFHDSGYSEVNLSLKEQQTIVRSFNGYVLGIARKQNVIALEGDAGWRFSRDQQPRPQVRCRHQCVDDAVAVLWFPDQKKAFDFFSNSFRNRFRQEGFPSPHGWEGHYIPLQSPPFLKTLDTYLVLEIMNVSRSSEERQRAVQQFEVQTRQRILKFIPNSLPFVASATRLFGRDEYFKPGTLFKDKSKVMISRFDSMAELSQLWREGIIQEGLRENNITGNINVFAFSLKDWQDY